MKKREAVAAAFASTVRKLQATGFLSRRSIADELSRRRVPTERGGRWHYTSVVRMLMRLGMDKPVYGEAGSGAASRCLRPQVVHFQHPDDLLFAEPRSFHPLVLPSKGQTPLQPGSNDGGKVSIPSANVSIVPVVTFRLQCRLRLRHGVCMTAYELASGPPATIAAIQGRYSLHARHLKAGDAVAESCADLKSAISRASELIEAGRNIEIQSSASL